MALYKAIHPNAEVNGQTVLAIANGLLTMKDFGLRILKDNGLVNIKPDGWYSQQLWLNSFKQISERIGPSTLYAIGCSIPDNAKFPEEIDDIFKALASIDIAYHMNHRIENEVLFSPETGIKSEGIGNYHYTKISDTAISIKCDNPYPCEFDRGIIEQMANKFKPMNSKLTVEHNETNGCRKKGGEICEYLISWTLLS